MNAQTTENSPRIKKETKNKIRVDFERTSFWTRFRLKFLTGNAVGKAIWWLFRLVLLLGISYVILQPFYSKIASSFMSREDFVDVTVKLIPKHPTLDTYKAIIRESGYLTALLNTTVLSVSCALIQTFICSLIGYGFAKYKFKGSKLLFALVLLTMIVPHKTLHLSLFMKFRYFDIGFGDYGILSLLGGGVFENFRLLKITSLNLNNSYWPLILLSLGGLGFKNGLFIFMMRQFFRGVPDELEESAYIDGYGPLRTFFRIIVPISIPMMITVFLFAFSWQWTDNFYTTTFFTTTGPKLLPKIVMIPKSLDTNYYLLPYLVLDIKKYKTISIAIQYLKGGYGTIDMGAMMGTLVLAIVPIIIFYLFCQRYLVQGIERSGIVG